MPRLPTLLPRVPRDALRGAPPSRDSRFRWFHALAPQIFAIPHKASMYNLVDRKDLTNFGTGATPTVGKGIGTGVTNNVNQSWIKTLATASGTTPRQTYAFLGTINSLAASNFLGVTGDGNAAGVVTAIVIATSGQVDFWRFGFAIDSFTSLVMAANVPYFLIVVHDAPANTVTGYLKNLNTGVVVVQSVASGQQTSDAAFYSFGSRHLTGLEGESRLTCYMQAYMRGAARDAHVRQWLRDPYGPYRAPETRQYFASSAAFTTYPYTMSGGVSTSGAGVVSLAKRIVSAGGVSSGGIAAARVSYVPAAPTGGVTTSGTASTKSTRAHMMTGGVQTGGSAPAKQTRAIIMAGGVTSSGAAVVRLAKAIAMSGGVTTGGNATGIFARGHIMTGGVSTGGSATLSRRYGWSSSGGVTTGGQAGIVFQGVFTVIMSGGVQTGGTAAARVSYRPPLPTGGVSTGGAGVASRVYGVRGVGGVTTAGAAVLSSVRRPTMAGGVQTGGQAFAQYIFGGTVLAAWAATFRARPLLDVRLTMRPQLETHLRGHPTETPE